MQKLNLQNERPFPMIYDEIKSLGYESYVFGQKSYNGVAILSKKKIGNIKNDIIKERVMRGGSFLCDEAICRGYNITRD